MTCKKCKWEFCWVCMGPWSEHGTNWYQCNRFDEKSGIDARDVQAKSRASLERYLHVSLPYFLIEKYSWSHSTVLQPMGKPWALCQTRHRILCQNGKENGTNAGCRQPLLDRSAICETSSRRRHPGANHPQVDLLHGFLVDPPFVSKYDKLLTLANSLKRNNQTELFEDNQRDLERAVENLSYLLEQNIGEPESIAKLRHDVTNQAAYVQKRHEIMMDDTLRGHLEVSFSFFQHSGAQTLTIAGRL